MKIIEAINAIDTLKPNGYTQMEKIGWLSYLDGMIKAEIIDTHEGAEGIRFFGYDENTDLDTELLAAEPYGRDLYIKYLENQMDYYNGETEKYNNSLVMYQAAYLAFARWYNRNHLPLSQKRKYWQGGKT